MKKEERKDINMKFCLNHIPKLDGKISDSFEPYLKPYTLKEMDQLTKTLNATIRKDKPDP